MEKVRSAEFEEKLTSSQYVIIDFGSPGCAPCKKVPPLLEEILQEMDGIDISAYEVDITEDPDIARKFFVMGVPTIIIFKEGKEIKRFNSVPKKDKIKKAIA
jgi:thioredoxin 1